MNQKKVGEFIKKLRKENHLTQAEFAEKYGITYQAVSNWEHGKNLPDIALLKQIADDFNVSIDELLGSEKKPLKKDNNYLIISVIIAVALIILFIIYLNKHNDFEFKTLSANCSNFKISGSISYNKDKTSIYINNINYCDTSNEKEYVKIECILYEKYNNIEKQISTSDEDRHHGEPELRMQQRIQFSEHILPLYDSGDDAAGGHNDAAEKPYQADLRAGIVSVKCTEQNHKRSRSDDRPTLDDYARGQDGESEQRGDEVGVKHERVDRAREDCQANGRDSESTPNPAHSLVEIGFRSVTPLL